MNVIKEFLLNEELAKTEVEKKLGREVNKLIPCTITVSRQQGKKNGERKDLMLPDQSYTVWLEETPSAPISQDTPKDEQKLAVLRIVNNPKHLNQINVEEVRICDITNKCVITHFEQAGVKYQKHLVDGIVTFGVAVRKKANQPFTIGQKAEKKHFAKK